MTDRRAFMAQTMGAAVAAGMVSGAAQAAKARRPAAPRKFQCRYAPHFGMFKESAGEDLVSQLEFMADQGFTALEDNDLMKRPVEVQTRIGETLAKRGMTMGVFVIDGGDNWKTSLTTGKAEFRDKFLETCRAAVEVGKRVNARWATVVPGYFERKLPMGIQTGNVIDILRAGAEILEPAKLTMVLEPLSDNPDLFLRTSDQAYAICRAVDSPSCKILYDMYHMQRNEGDMVSHINQAWSEISGSASGGASATDSYHAGEPLAEPPPSYTHPRKNWRLKRSAVPQWYKQRHGVRAKALSGAARVARFRPPRAS